ncbi:MAG: peptidoglycan editing factor PgeF [Pseudomonadota bacterium]
MPPADPVVVIGPDWSSAAPALAATTQRSGGVSRDEFASLNLAAHVGDSPAAVAENRRRLLAATGLAGEPAWLNQLHGTDIVETNQWRGEPLSADAAIVRRGGRPAVVLTADCLPILLLADDGDVGAAVHAGWRGLAAGIVEAAIAGTGTEPVRLRAWVGPGIGQAAYEVGDDVRAAFGAAGAARFRPNARGRWQADLAGLAADRLRAAGVADIQISDVCTCRDAERFFSYRRDGRCGRMATVLAL